MKGRRSTVRSRQAVVCGFRNLRLARGQAAPFQRTGRNQRGSHLPGSDLKHSGAGSATELRASWARVLQSTDWGNIVAQDGRRPVALHPRPLRQVPCLELCLLLLSGRRKNNEKKREPSCQWKKTQTILRRQEVKKTNGSVDQMRSRFVP